MKKLNAIAKGFSIALLAFGCQNPSLNVSSTTVATVDFDRYVQETGLVPFEGNYLFEGDIVVPAADAKAAYEEYQNRARGNVSTKVERYGFLNLKKRTVYNIWSGADKMNLRFAFMTDLSTSALSNQEVQKAFFEAAATWESAANIRFIQSTNPLFGIEKVSSDKNNPAWANYPNADFPKISFNVRIADNYGYNSVRSIFIHELGHILGLAHEHQRADSPNTFGQGVEADSTPYGAYDVNSIMDYHSSYNSSISAGDRDTISHLYGHPVSNYTVLANPDSPTFFRNQPNQGVMWPIRFAGNSYFQANRPSLNQYSFPQQVSGERVLPIDFNGDGYTDLFVYYPGQGLAYLIQSNSDHTYTTIQNPWMARHDGFNGFDFKASQDTAVVLDFNGDGKQDLMFYRTGQGTVWLCQSNADGTFTTVYAGQGLNGFDFKASQDQVRVLDFDHKNGDDLFLYRGGQGTCWLIQSNGNGSFTTKYAGQGFTGFDFKSTDDQVKVLDYNGDHLDDLMMYRRVQGTVWFSKSNGDGTFTAQYANQGLAGYDFKAPQDQVTIVDYDGDEKDDVFMYRPDSGAAYLAKSLGNGAFQQVRGGSGFDGYDFRSAADRVLAVRLDPTSKRQDLMFYRYDNPSVYIYRSNGDATFTSVIKEGSGFVGF